MVALVDIFTLLFVFLFIFLGYKRGLVGSILSFASSFLCIPLAGVISLAFSKSGIYTGIVMFIVMFFVLKITFSVLGFSLSFIKKIPIIKTVNALGGSIFGLLNGLILTTFLCYSLLIFLDLTDKSLSDTIFDGSYICRYLVILFGKIL